jgi:hypothetical protein
MYLLAVVLLIGAAITLTIASKLVNR